MQTDFSPEVLRRPGMATSAAIIRKCVHCGFCTATCPTYVLLGDELDSPRGRIYLMKEMLEKGQRPSANVVKHIDRCLSCLSCMTTCPSDVNYMHLVDHARAYIEENYKRPWRERLVRRILAWLLPHPRRFRLALKLARWTKPLSALVPVSSPLAAMVRLVPKAGPEKPVSGSAAGPGLRKGRVVLLQGCVESVLRPEIRAAAMRLLSRAGYEVTLAAGEGCCGALVHHMGFRDESLEAARLNVRIWSEEIERGGLDAILVTASGCGTTIKDYAFLLRDDPAYSEMAARVSSLTRDISEFLAGIALPAVQVQGLTVAYHDACSLQHGQGVKEAPRQLLHDAGFVVRTPRESHLCCGSAGVYNILQPEIAGRLGERKAAHLEQLEADVIATGNIGCAVQIGVHASLPVVHTIELLDWATGGPMPAALSSAGFMGRSVGL